MIEFDEVQLAMFSFMKSMKRKDELMAMAIHQKSSTEWISSSANRLIGIKA